MIHGWMDSIPKDFNRLVTQDEMRALFYWKDKLEEAFEREHRNLDVFTVTPKGLYNTRLLIEAPENDFPRNFAQHFRSRCYMTCNRRQDAWPLTFLPLALSTSAGGRNHSCSLTMQGWLGTRGIFPRTKIGINTSTISRKKGHLPKSQIGSKRSRIQTGTR